MMRAAGRSRHVSVPVASPSAPLLGIQTHGPALAIRWSHVDQWMIISPQQTQANNRDTNGEPAIAIQWWPFLEPDDGAWIDTAEPPHHLGHCARRLREQLNAINHQLHQLCDTIDALDHYP